MKKSIKLSLIFSVLAVISLFTVTVHASDSIKFTTVQTYNGITYTCADTFYSGELVSSNIQSLPCSVTSHDEIYSFAIYYDKIYYFVGDGGTELSCASIFRCNLDGSNNELIANNVLSRSTPFLSDGCLYYNILNSVYEDTRGIVKINLNTGICRKIITDNDASLVNVLEDKIFYHVWKADEYHLMNTNSTYIGRLSANDVEVSSDIIIGAMTYNGYDGAIYASCWGSNSKWICNVPRYVNGHTAYYQNPTVINVTGGYIYYEMGFKISPINAAPNTAILRVPVSGGASELVAQWFEP